MFKVVVEFEGGSESYNGISVRAAIRKTRKKHGDIEITNVTSINGHIQKLPQPPENYRPGAFKVKVGRFGRMTAGKFVPYKDDFTD